MDKLKPCPFCGNQHPSMEKSSIGEEIYCPCCQIRFRCFSTIWVEDEKVEVIKRWNRRSGEESK